MKKTFNKILSSALALVMIFAALIILFPQKADAAYNGATDASKDALSSDAVKQIVKEAYAYNFDSAEEMLAYELSNGYLDTVTTKNGEYSIYVNRYTGVLYYVNNWTGQILTSNPYQYSEGNDATVNKLLLSQISVEFSEIAMGTKYDYNSTDWAALYTQISTEYINGGIRVKYTLGDTTARFLLPGRINADKFEEMVLIPMINDLGQRMEEYCADKLAAYEGSNKKIDKNTIFNVFEDPNFSQYDETNPDEKSDANKYNIIFMGHINSRALKTYCENMQEIYNELYKKDKNSAELAELKGLKGDIIQILGAYSLQNPAIYADKPDSSAYTNMITNYYTPEDGVDPDLEVFTELTPMYTLGTDLLVNQKRNYSLIFREYAGSYTFSEMFQDEKSCGYVDTTDLKPVIRCALEYTFNSDGSLSVRLPANSISFDDTVYNLTKITPLKFFGVGDLKEDGYIFYPDGSGTIIDFEDFYNDAEKVSVYDYSGTFGKDFCYSNITGAHREQITMPVYGVVAETTANAKTQFMYGLDKVTNGYFAIIEEGESLATIGFETGGSRYRYGGAFCWYCPYPSDQYDLSETLSVGSATSYTIVSDSEYNGSYVTRYVMLTDSKIGDVAYGKDAYYPSNYVGMATYYRNRLLEEGVLNPIELVSSDLPLYIEALGSMEIIEKVLSFPVTKKIALTEFEHIEIMYKELANAAAKFEEDAKEYDRLASELTSEADTELKAQYERSAAACRELVKQVETIENINFRLTGFGNGGLYSTYPTRVRWDKACGGKKAFESLMSAARDASSAEGVNFGVYPEYDFMYINYTEMFDGVRVKGNVSRMVDNRYASKQEYDSVLQEYVSYYALVVNPESLEELYAKFLKKISKYDVNTISVSTIGSDLNSNFDEDQPVNRDEAQGYVTAVLEKMVNQDGFEIMTDKGNIYSVKYADHILNMSVDSSHLAYSSYTIPFTGMILHGYASYAGAPLNYSGTPKYDMLRAIESGASIYYILCYQNTEYMKEDTTLNDYYGVDYETWFEDVVLSYKTMNEAIGDLQTYQIIDHEIVIGERVITDAEMNKNYKLLKEELVDMLYDQIANAVAKGYEDLAASESAYGRNLAVVITEDDKNALMLQFADLLQLEVADIAGTDFETEIDGVISYFNTEYAKKGTDDYVVTLNSIVYDSKYSFITDSEATSGEDYKRTDFTSDVGNISLVTYSDGENEVQFILNYNMYAVEVIHNGVKYTLGEYEYVRINVEGGNA